MTDRAALFVRVPVEVMDAVDARARATGRTKQSLVTEFVESALQPEPGPTADGSGDSVCDLDEIAALLRVAPDDVLSRIAADDLPGRRIGGQWRFSRAAVMRWLEGADRPDRPTPGFSP